MSEKQKLSIVIPAYNEEESIGMFLREVEPAAKEFRCEVIVVDDGSTDKTFEIIKQFPFKIIKHPYNKGYGASLKTGIRNSENEVIITLDADGQHEIRFIKDFLSHMEMFDMIIGARKQKSEHLLHRSIGKIIINKVSSYLMGVKVLDVNSGFRIFSKTKAMRFFHILPNGFSFSTTLTLSFLKEGYSVEFIEIKTLPRQRGKSSVNILKDGIQTFLLILRIVVMFNPLKVFIPVAVFLLVFGIAFSIYSILLYGRISSTGIITLIVGLNILFFGMLSDQISALRRGLRE